MVPTDKIDVEFLERIKKAPNEQYLVEILYPHGNTGLKSRLELIESNIQLLDQYAQTLKNAGVDCNPRYASHTIQANLTFDQIAKLLNNSTVVSITASCSQPIYDSPKKWEPSPYI